MVCVVPCCPRPLDAASFFAYSQRTFNVDDGSSVWSKSTLTLVCMLYSLSAMKREGRVQDILAAGRIPAIMYGIGIASQPLSVPRSEFVKVAKAAG